MRKLRGNERVFVEPSPREEDVLFRDDLPDRMYNACLNTICAGDHSGYMEGYRRGAYLLVQHVVETASDMDCLVYPVVFLYRHVIELALKRMIRRAPYLTGANLSQAERRHLESHRLDVLWKDLKPRLAAMIESANWEPLDPEDIKGIDSYIGQLIELDPNSYSFRYVTTKDGHVSLPPGLVGINLRHFAEMMERLTDYLDGMDHATEDLEDMKAEMEAEYRRNTA